MFLQVICVPLGMCLLVFLGFFRIFGHFSQCGNFRIFLSFRFFVKSILEKLEVLKLLFLPFSYDVVKNHFHGVFSQVSEFFVFPHCESTSLTCPWFDKRLFGQTTFIEKPLIAMNQEKNWRDSIHSFILLRKFPIFSSAYVALKLILPLS